MRHAADPPRARPTRGFTIAEVMVALVLLSIALFGLVAAQVHFLRSTSENQARHLACEIAASRMALVESRLRTDFGNVAQGSTPVPDREGFACAVQERLEAKKVKRVEVRVAYKDPAGEHEYVLWTYFYDGRS